MKTYINDKEIARILHDWKYRGFVVANVFTEEEAEELNNFQVESDDEVLEISDALKSRKKPKISVSKRHQVDFIPATSCEIDDYFLWPKMLTVKSVKDSNSKL
jgi:hypothetical protein